MKTLAIIIEFPMTEKKYRKFSQGELARRIRMPYPNGDTGLEFFGKKGMFVGGAIIEEHGDMKRIFDHFKAMNKED